MTPCPHARRAGDTCRDCGAVVRDGIGPLSTLGCRVAATPPVWPADVADALRADVARHQDIADRAVAECQRLRAGHAAMHRRAQAAEVCAARALRFGLLACDDLRRQLARALTSPTAAERAEVYGLLEGASREYAALRRDEAHAQREVARLSAELTATWADAAARPSDARAESRAEIDALRQDRDLLLEYARHHAGCSGDLCDCGLDAIRRAAGGE